MRVWPVKLRFFFSLCRHRICFFSASVIEFLPFKSSARVRLHSLFFTQRSVRCLHYVCQSNYLCRPHAQVWYWPNLQRFALCKYILSNKSRVPKGGKKKAGKDPSKDFWTRKQHFASDEHLKRDWEELKNMFQEDKKFDGYESAAVSGGARRPCVTWLQLDLHMRSLPPSSRQAQLSMIRTMLMIHSSSTSTSPSPL